MWIALDERNADGAVEQVLPRLEALVQFADGLERRLSADGLGGIAGTLDLYRRLAAALKAIPETELARVRDETRLLTVSMLDVARQVEDLRRLSRAR